MNQARFIVFEGIEGAGKSTQLSLLCDYLRSNNFQVIATREPGGTPEADEIRKCIVRSSKGSMLPLTELLLIQAARVEHVEKVIKPGLHTHDYILCDRYIYSSLAYQGYASGLNLDMIHSLNSLSTQNILPNQVILLDADPQITLQRSIQRLSQQAQEHREDRFENEDLTFHHNVRHGFLEIAKQKPEIFSTFNAMQAMDDLHTAIKLSLEV